MSDAEILEQLKAIFAETFEINTAQITHDTHLFEELDLDSIDAVDLAIKLQEMAGKRIRPENFKSVRTVGDVVGTVRVLLAA